MRRTEDRGFTLVELMVAVLVIGILVAIAIPIFNSAQSNARKRSCFANQRIIESGAQMWASDHGGDFTALAGLIVASHPLVNTHIFKRPPSCPSAPRPADPMNPTVATGAYSLNASGTVAPCAFGGHGGYTD